MFELLVFLHILTVVVGIGSVVLNGVYAKLAMKGEGTEGVAVSEANYTVSALAEKFIYAIPVFGILAVLTSPSDVYEFSQTWLWLSALLYVVAMGISHAIVMPGHRRINELLRKMHTGQGGQADGEEMMAIGKRLAPGGMALDLIAVVIIGLMVWKPGV